MVSTKKEAVNREKLHKMKFTDYWVNQLSDAELTDREHEIREFFDQIAGSAEKRLNGKSRLKPDEMEKMIEFSDYVEVPDAQRTPGGDSFAVSEGAAGGSCDGKIGKIQHPPTTNRGVLNSKTDETAPLKTDYPEYYGGFDGGTEIGFKGIWYFPGNLDPAEHFKKLTELLEQARTAAASPIAEVRKAARITLGGLDFLVQSHGTGQGVTYRYVLVGNGFTVKIHQSTIATNVQPVRILYNWSSLDGQDFFKLHEQVKEWLALIGFFIAEESVSRVDLQITARIKPGPVLDLAASDHRVCSSRKVHIVKAKEGISYFRTGNNALTVRLYDKGLELREVFDPDKQTAVYSHFTDFCPDELLRVEYQLRRDFFKLAKINTVEDLRDKLPSMVFYLVNWFRLLEEPKTKGNSSKMKTAAVWAFIQNAFIETFKGGFKMFTRNETKTDNRFIENLEKQAAGVLSTVFGLGDLSLSPKEKLQIFLEKYEEKIFEQTDAKEEERIIKNRQCSTIPGDGPQIWNPATPYNQDPETAPLRRLSKNVSNVYEGATEADGVVRWTFRTSDGRTFTPEALEGHYPCSIFEGVAIPADSITDGDPVAFDDSRGEYFNLRFGYFIPLENQPDSSEVYPLRRLSLDVNNTYEGDYHTDEDDAVYWIIKTYDGETYYPEAPKGCYPCDVCDGIPTPSGFALVGEPVAFDNIRGELLNVRTGEYIPTNWPLIPDDFDEMMEDEITCEYILNQDGEILPPQNALGEIPY